MRSFLNKRILLAIFLDVFAFISVFFIYSTTYSLLNFDPQTHIRYIDNPLYNYFIDLFLLFISQITLIYFINSKLLKNKSEIKIVHLSFLIIVTICLFLYSTPMLVERLRCGEILGSPVLRNMQDSNTDMCATFMENSGKGLAAILFIGFPAICLFTFFSLFLNLFLKDLETVKTKFFVKLISLISMLLILAYPTYIILRIIIFLNRLPK